jgi:hypothetical protein
MTSNTTVTVVDQTFAEVRARKRSKTTEASCNKFLENLRGPQDADIMLQDEKIRQLLIKLGKEMIAGQVPEVSRQVPEPGQPKSALFTLSASEELVQLRFLPSSNREGTRTWGFNTETGKGGKYDMQSKEFDGYYWPQSPERDE